MSCVFQQYFSILIFMVLYFNTMKYKNYLVDDKISTTRRSKSNNFPKINYKFMSARCLKRKKKLFLCEIYKQRNPVVVTTTKIYITKQSIKTDLFLTKFVKDSTLKKLRCYTKRNLLITP